MLDEMFLHLALKKHIDKFFHTFQLDVTDIEPKYALKID